VGAAITAVGRSEHRLAVGGHLLQQWWGETGEGQNRGEGLVGWSGEKGNEAEGIREGFGK